MWWEVNVGRNECGVEDECMWCGKKWVGGGQKSAGRDECGVK